MRNKRDTLIQVLAAFPTNVSFRRSLVGLKLIAWTELLDRLINVNLSPGHDEFRWNLHANGVSSVKSMYQALIHSDVPIDSNNLWKLKVPLKIKIFLWFSLQGVILTKDNMLKRNWKGNSKCVFCHEDETIAHLFFHCRVSRSVWSMVQIASNLFSPRDATHMFGSWLRGVHKRLRALLMVGTVASCWAIWLCRNDIVFNRKNLTSPMQVLYSCTHWLRTWSTLLKPMDHQLDLIACSSLEQVVRDFFTHYGWRSSLRIEPAWSFYFSFVVIIEFCSVFVWLCVLRRRGRGCDTLWL